MDADFIKGLFDDKKDIYFPDVGGQAIKRVDIKKQSQDWAKDTYLAQYEVMYAIFATDGWRYFGPEDKRSHITRVEALIREAKIFADAFKPSI